MTGTVSNSGCSMPKTATATSVGGAEGGGASTVAGGSSTAQAQAGVSTLGGGEQLAGILQALNALMERLSALISQLAGANGGGPAQQIAAPSGITAGATSATPVQQAPIDHGSHALPKSPPKGDPRFLDGSVGPTVKKGKAEDIKIPDGKGFHGAKGRKQNADDKTKNNYSVTDANFSNQLGLLPKDPDTGKPMTYVQHIQTYAAANYLETYNQPLYQKLVANQNAGKGTILGAAANLMGLTKTQDPAQEGVTQADIAAIPTKIPGTPMDARAYITSGKDITGQDWARPHHAGSQFKALSSLIGAGVNWKDAMVLAGDDGISGAGRLNGVNGQNGKTGFNGGEKEIWAKAAQIQQQTGINVVQLLMGGHNHLGGDKSALTNPNINKLLGLDKGDRSSSDARANAIYQALIGGKVKGDANANGTKADNKNLLKYASGGVAPLTPAATTSTATVAPTPTYSQVQYTTPVVTAAPPAAMSHTS